MAMSLAGGPADAATDVLDAVARLLLNQDLHDVAFICGRDGGVVTSNKAYLAARCEYFRLLFSSAWREGGSSDVHLPHASSDALQLVLRYLFTSQLPGADVGWQTLMEACSLAQQYLLPSVVSFVAARLSSQLQPEDLGAALSYALQENLAPVVTAIWLATPALLSCPVRLDPSYSAAAVNFLLDHSALVGSAPPGHHGSDIGSSGNGGGVNGALIPFAGGCRCADVSGGMAAAGAPARGGAKGPAPAAGGGGGGAAAAGAGAGAASAAAAAGAAAGGGHGCWIASEPDVLRAVLAWTEQASRCCDDCAALRGGRCCGASGGCVAAAAPATTGDAPVKGGVGDDAARAPDAGGAKCGDKGAAVSAAAAANGHHGKAERAGASADSSTGSASAPASDAAADAEATAADAAPRAAAGNDAGAGAANGSSSGPRYCRRHQQLLCGFLCRLNLQLLDPTTLEALESAGLVSGEALVSAYRWAARCLHAALRGRFRAGGAGGVGPAGGGGGAAAGALGAVLGVVGPAGGGAGGGAGAAGGGGAAAPLCDGVFSHTKDGVEVLESRSPSHINVVTWEPLSGGRHVWTVHVRSACDLVWLGVSDGTLDPHVWGGKQAGGWLYGSNDALCSAVSDKHAYSKTCGHGKWGDGAVVAVFLDLEEGKLWFAVNGSEPRLGFSGLPPRIFPTVSIRAPAVLGFHFRAASWGSGGGGDGAAGAPAGAPPA